MAFLSARKTRAGIASALASSLVACGGGASTEPTQAAQNLKLDKVTVTVDATATSGSAYTVAGFVGPTGGKFDGNSATIEYTFTPKGSTASPTADSNGTAYANSLSGEVGSFATVNTNATATSADKNWKSEWTIETKGKTDERSKTNGLLATQYTSAGQTITVMEVSATQDPKPAFPYLPSASRVTTSVAVDAPFKQTANVPFVVDDALCKVASTKNPLVIDIKPDNGSSASFEENGKPFGILPAYNQTAALRPTRITIKPECSTQAVK